MVLPWLLGKHHHLPNSYGEAETRARSNPGRQNLKSDEGIWTNGESSFLDTTVYLENNWIRIHLYMYVKTTDKH